MTIKSQVESKLIELGAGTALVHSDLMQGFSIPFKSRNTFLSSHMDELLSLKRDLNIWMPSFNYNFCRGEIYNIDTTPSQVGNLSEYFRKEVAEWRTHIPVFSFAGTGEEPVLKFSETIDPFGSESAFHELFQRNAVMIHYGSQFKTSTVIHYAERMSGVLSYRYDKLFPGKIISSSMEKDVEFNFHVRPMGKHLDYDWQKIESDLIRNGILFVYQQDNSKIQMCSIRDLVSYWISRIQQHPLYLLDAESKQWVEPMLNKLGRSFRIDDFES